MPGLLSVLQNARIDLPIVEIAVLVMSLSFFLVFKMTRVGLIAAYLFTYRWGLLFFTRQASDFLVFYLLFGFAVGLLTIIGMVWSSSAN